MIQNNFFFFSFLFVLFESIGLGNGALSRACGGSKVNRMVSDRIVVDAFEAFSGEINELGPFSSVFVAVLSGLGCTAE